MAHVVTVGEPRTSSADGKVPSASGIYLHKGSKDGLPQLDVSTLYELFNRSVSNPEIANNACLGQRERKPDGTAGEYSFITYKQAGDQVKELASGLRAIGVDDPKARVGVFGANCPEWMIAMQVSNLHVEGTSMHPNLRFWHDERC